ncbi:hypothetical protein Hypma_013727 [Hypsizygus marmoreus]|uniref:Uncharacterized protein n=1 Tax=Hypsizygus marmoreus TaxID=39966 RepID=A0A369JBM4_HYPMA|nr:hypothetical protein Hypma_013727 [Hypsizygus marmoreus]
MQGKPSTVELLDTTTLATITRDLSQPAQPARIPEESTDAGWNREGGGLNVRANEKREHDSLNVGEEHGALKKKITEALNITIEKEKHVGYTQRQEDEETWQTVNRLDKECADIEAHVRSLEQTVREKKEEKAQLERELAKLKLKSKD